MERFYVDTNIWLDYALNRSNGIRPLGEFAFQFFKKCIRNRWQILYSDFVVGELEEHLKPGEIQERCFSIVSDRGLLLKVALSKKQSFEAEAISKRLRIPFGDAIHAVIARDNKAAIVSRDAHFQALYEIVTVFFPEET